MIQVNYAMSYPYISNPPGYALLPTQHAWLELEVYHQSKSWRFFAIVDTGADDLILDTGVASYLGIPQGPQNYSVVTAGGTVPMQRQPGMTVDVAGTTIQTDVVFGVLPLPLLGRRALLAAVEFGFGQRDWYHT
jgi:predicted aspartyl protease